MDGFDPTIEQVDVTDSHLRLIGPYIGGFVDSDGSIYLRDREDNRWSLKEIGFANAGMTQNEGRLRFPRPFKFDTEGALLRRGDTVLIFFERGDLTNPIVFGGVRPFDTDKGGFHSFTPEDYEKIHEQYVSSERLYRLKDDGKGGIEGTLETYDAPVDTNIEDTDELRADRKIGSLTYVISKDGEIMIDLTELTGKGNIALNLHGNDRSVNGNVSISYNGRMKLTQTDDDGAKLQEIEIGDEYVTIDSDQINLGTENLEPIVLGDKLVGILGDLLTAIIGMSHAHPMGPTIPGPINVAAFNKVQTDLTKILSSQNKTE